MRGAHPGRLIPVKAEPQTHVECRAEDEHSVTFIEELQRRLAHQAAPDAKGGGRMTSSQSSPNLTTQVGFLSLC